ncbi:MULTISPECIES: GGDEF domain-containing protein [Erwiniaceae]|uniref:GGDEF domain-containing protein n=1 Tax=Erwiniaceae TaxID=1903409 RepID=UPI00190CD63B|nr:MULTISPECIES: GGDEF domain-containing protein [Erwiniaceae]MBK0003254.1 diguanylate cyclase [Erwinia sp. S38]MBM7342217.1 diguanylate cyclase (GGDEF)-like protein [Pantoea coffeiphila]
MPNNKNRIHQVIVLFFFAILLSVIGLCFRNFESMSIFWPGNAVLLGLLIRFPALDNRVSLLVLFFGMLITDLCWGTPAMISVGVNFSNITFIAAARWVLLTRHFTRPYPRRLQSLMRIFPASIAGALVCAAIGGIVSERYFHDELFKAWFSWFSEQMSTSILLLPAVISLPRRDELRLILRKTFESSLLPLVALLVTTAMSIWVGGGGSLLFPLPALLWCAISYPLFITCCLTLITGISEIILVAGNVLNIQGENDLFRIDSLSAARLGVAAMTISPLIVSLSIEANKRLVARVTRRADYDLLTGALTRSGLSSRLQSLIAPRNRLTGFSGALFLVDIDRFKNINDTWGHAAGDYVLAQTVHCIQQALPPTSLVCRMGGEEFLVLLEGANEARAFLLANRLRNSIENNAIMHKGNDLSVTASIGISLLNISSVQALDEAINRADEQLYIAKSSGRNQVRPEFVL